MPKAFGSALVLGKITSCNLEMKDRKHSQKEVSLFMKSIRKRLCKSRHVQQKENYDMIDALSKFSEGSF